MSIVHIKLITEYTNNYSDMAIFIKTDIKLFLNKLEHISIFERQQSKILWKRFKKHIYNFRTQQQEIWKSKVNDPRLYLKKHTQKKTKNNGTNNSVQKEKILMN